MKKEVKKLHRMLLAAGIEFEYKPKTKCTVIPWTTYDNDGRTFHEYEWSKKIVVKEGAEMVFRSTKAYVKFEGNDWDGLLERLKMSDIWRSIPNQAYEVICKYKKTILDNPSIRIYREKEIEVWNRKKVTWVEIKPFEVWAKMDKLEDAQSKGGSCSIKLGGYKYEFNFPELTKQQTT